MPGERRQHKTVYCMIQFIWYSTTKFRDRNQISGCQGMGASAGLTTKGPGNFEGVGNFLHLNRYKSFMTKYSCQNPSNCTLLNGVFNYE